MQENRIFVVVLVGLFIVAGIILANLRSFSAVESAVIRQIQDTQRFETAKAAQQIESRIFQMRDELSTLSKVQDIPALSEKRCSAGITHERVSSVLDILARANARGEVTACSSPEIAYFAGLNIANKEYFSIPKSTGKPYISGKESFGPVNQIIITSPIYTSGYALSSSFQGILLSTLTVNELFEDEIYPILNVPEKKFFIIDLEDLEVIATDETRFDVARIAAALPRSERIISKRITTDKIGEIILTSSEFVVGAEKWRLGIYTPMSSVAHDLRIFQQRNLYSLLFVLAIVVAVSIFLISLYRSKEDVESKLNEVSIALDKLGLKVRTDVPGSDSPSSIELLPQQLREKESLLPQEMEVLEFINAQNAENKLISFKDINKKFNITKPTTRARIAMLTGKHLAEIEQRGRFKTLKITEKGRKLLSV